MGRNTVVRRKKDKEEEELEVSTGIENPRRIVFCGGGEEKEVFAGSIYRNFPPVLGVARNLSEGGGSKESLSVEHSRGGGGDASFRLTVYSS